MLASFTQVVFLRVYSFSGSCVTNEGTEVQNGLYPGELLVCVCGSKQFLPLQVRSQPGGLGEACASFLPLRVPGEMWQKLLPCPKGSGLPSGPDLGGKKKFFFSSMALGMPANFRWHARLLPPLQ